MSVDETLLCSFQVSTRNGCATAGTTTECRSRRADARRLADPQAGREEEVVHVRRSRRSRAPRHAAAEKQGLEEGRPGVDVVPHPTCASTPPPALPSRAPTLLFFGVAIPGRRAGTWGAGIGRGGRSGPILRRRERGGPAHRQPQSTHALPTSSPFVLVCFPFALVYFWLVQNPRSHPFLLTPTTTPPHSLPDSHLGDVKRLCLLFVARARPVDTIRLCGGVPEHAFIICVGGRESRTQLLDSEDFARGSFKATWHHPALRSSFP